MLKVYYRIFLPTEAKIQTAYPSFKLKFKETIDVFGVFAQQDNFLGVSLLTVHPLDINFIVVFE